VWYCPCGKHMAVLNTAGDVARRGRRSHQEARVPPEGVVAVKAYTVRAKRWAHGWELHVDGVGVTQSRSLASAERQAREYVALMNDVPEDGFDVRLVVSVGREVDETVAEALRLREEADQIQARASQAVRSAVAALTKSGVSTVRDVGVVLGLSPQRVQQLKKQPVARTSARAGTPAVTSSPGRRHR